MKSTKGPMQKKSSQPRIVIKERNTEAMKEKSVINSILKEKSEYLHPSWVKRLFEVTDDALGTEEYKSYGLFEFFESELTHIWIFCRHLAVLLEFFKIGIANKSSFGSYRVELVVMLFDRLLDIHNFEYVLMVLNAEEIAAIMFRIGTVLSMIFIMSFLFSQGFSTFLIPINQKVVCRLSWSDGMNVRFVTNINNNYHI